MKVKAKDINTVICILEQIGVEYQGLLSIASLDGSLEDFLMHMEASGAWDEKSRIVLNKVLFIECLTTTHCEIDKDSAKVIHDAYDKDFLINASCETVSEVKRVKDLGVDAVIASVDPKETLKDLKEEGLKGVICPAQLAELAQVTEGMTCEKCRLCSKHRKAVVIFKVHGRAHKRATRVIMLKQQNQSK